MEPEYEEMEGLEFAALENTLTPTGKSVRARFLPKARRPHFVALTDFLAILYFSQRDSVFEQ
jgi:hypothetical protein